jgi:hypothetical protein
LIEVIRKVQKEEESKGYILFQKPREVFRYEAVVNINESS